jgi:RNA polymerase-binding transcription factor DksA
MVPQDCIWYTIFMIDQATMKTRLEEEKARMEGELKNHGRQSPATGDWQGGSDMAVDEADESEVADKVEDTANNVALVEELEARYKEVLNALEKFEKGTYGVCEHSGEAIPAERLEANPAARTCIAHA